MSDINAPKRVCPFVSVTVPVQGVRGSNGSQIVAPQAGNISFLSGWVPCCGEQCELWSRTAERCSIVQLADSDFETTVNQARIIGKLERLTNVATSLVQKIGSSKPFETSKGATETECPTGEGL
jgi:hypothetical protein